jgi:hypothetical protein
LRILCNIEGYLKIDPQKKELARKISEPAQRVLVPYVNLLPIVVMITVVAVIPVSVVPVVCWPGIIAVVRIRSVIAIWIVAVSIPRITNSDSDSPNANRNLSV